MRDCCRSDSSGMHLAPVVDLLQSSSRPLFQVPFMADSKNISIVADANCQDRRIVGLAESVRTIIFTVDPFIESFQPVIVPIGIAALTKVLFHPFQISQPSSGLQKVIIQRKLYVINDAFVFFPIVFEQNDIIKKFCAVFSNVFDISLKIWDNFGQFPGFQMPKPISSELKPRVICHDHARDRAVMNLSAIIRDRASIDQKLPQTSRFVRSKQNVATSTDHHRNDRVL